jgi:OHCU decarboxylase
MNDHSAKLDPPPSAQSRDEFVETYGGVFEHSPWIAEALWDQGLKAEYDLPEKLHAAMLTIVDAGGEQKQLALIRAHPDLAGKAALQGELTDASTSEQAGAGLDRMSQEDFDRFKRLNGAYMDRFGFPFVIAVKDLKVPDILTAFERRIENAPDRERATALEQIAKITLFRLRAMAS